MGIVNVIGVDRISLFDDAIELGEKILYKGTVLLISRYGDDRSSRIQPDPSQLFDKLAILILLSQQNLQRVIVREVYFLDTNVLMGFCFQIMGNLSVLCPYLTISWPSVQQLLLQLLLPQ